VGGDHSLVIPIERTELDQRLLLVPQSVLVHYGDSASATRLFTVIHSPREGDTAIREIDLLAELTCFAGEDATVEILCLCGIGRGER
jgi:hypothetical protein